jgi:hypothetical protein
MINIDSITKTKAFESIKSAKTQTDFYLENGAHPDVIRMVKLGNKSFGEKLQRIILEQLNLDKPTSTGHDVQQKSSGKKFEVKSSRFWTTNADWKWQHIMEDHDYNYLLLVGINFQGIDVFIITKEKFLSLKPLGLVTQQGGAEGQGLWCDYSKIKQFLTPISSESELNEFIKNN